MRARERDSSDRGGALPSAGARARARKYYNRRSLGFSLNGTYAMRNGTMELTLKIAGVPVEEFVHAKETCALLALPYHHQACDVPSSGL